MDKKCHRIETVRLFRVPGHTTDRNLIDCAHKHRAGQDNLRTYDPPNTGEICSNGPVDAKQVADLAVKCRIGPFFVDCNGAAHCRGPPFRLNAQNSDGKRVKSVSAKRRKVFF